MEEFYVEFEVFENNVWPGGPALFLVFDLFLTKTIFLARKRPLFSNNKTRVLSYVKTVVQVFQ